MPVSTTIFKTNKTQAVRLPKEVAFPDGVREVEIIVIGETRLICPAGKRWESYFARETRPTEDFLANRDQGEFEKRDPIF